MNCDVYSFLFPFLFLFPFPSPFPFLCAFLVLSPFPSLVLFLFLSPFLFRVLFAWTRMMKILKATYVSILILTLNELSGVVCVVVVKWMIHRSPSRLTRLHLINHLNVLRVGDVDPVSYHVYFCCLLCLFYCSFVENYCFLDGLSCGVCSLTLLVSIHRWLFDVLT